MKQCEIIGDNWGITFQAVGASPIIPNSTRKGTDGKRVTTEIQDWHSWRDKPRLYYKFLKKFAVENPGRWVVLVDGFDTIFGGCSEEKLLEFFNRTVSAAGGEERSVVWGAENCCFPWRDSCSEYMHLTARRQAVLQEFGMKEAFEKLGDCRRCRDLDLPGYDSFCSSPPAYQHLNSGFLMGRAEHVLQSVSAWLKLYSNHSETDQLVARDLFLQHSDRPFLPFMTLDYSGALVLTVGNIPESAIPEVFSIRENGIYNLQTGLVQCFIHGAGPGKAFVAQLLRSQR